MFTRFPLCSEKNAAADDPHKGIPKIHVTAKDVDPGAGHNKATPLRGRTTIIVRRSNLPQQDNVVDEDVKVGACDKLGKIGATLSLI